MNKLTPIKFSFAVSLAISFIFLLITFWIFYKYSWNAESAKDALSTTGSYFGAAATLGAAIIAAYLFNDWRDQKKYELEKEYIEKFAISVFDIYQLIFSQSSQILYMYDNYNKNENYTILRLDNVDFLKISENDRSTHYHSDLINRILPESEFKLYYENFQECLTYLCWVNDQVYTIYSKQIIDSQYDSPFIAYFLEEDQMKKNQLDNYEIIIRIVNNKSPININNKEQQVSYSELLNEFTNSFERLNYEIIKYIKP